MNLGEEFDMSASCIISISTDEDRVWHNCSSNPTYDEFKKQAGTNMVCWKQNHRVTDQVTGDIGLVVAAAATVTATVTAATAASRK